MTLSQVIKLIAALVVIGILAGTYYYVQNVLTTTALPAKEEKTLLSSLESAELADIELGDRTFSQAAEHLSSDNYDKAREKLQFITDNYAGSNAAVEARRILGEMNLDKLLSPTDMTGKITYTVQRGDNYSRIAFKHNSNLANLILLNNLSRLDRLQPRDKLILLPLNHTVIIDPRSNRLLVQSEEGEFIKSYPILRNQFSKNSRNLWETTVTKTIGLLNGRSYPDTDLRYLQSQKEIHLKKSRLKILPQTDTPHSSDRAIYLSPTDLEELTLLIRPGTKVQIRFPLK